MKKILLYKTALTILATGVSLGISIVTFIKEEKLRKKLYILSDNDVDRISKKILSDLQKGISEDKDSSDTIN